MYQFRQMNANAIPDQESEVEEFNALDQETSAMNSSSAPSQEYKDFSHDSDRANHGTKPQNASMSSEEHEDRLKRIRELLYKRRKIIAKTRFYLQQQN